MNKLSVGKQLWERLGSQQAYYHEPDEVNPPVWRIKTRQLEPEQTSFMFDDAFWEVFQSLSLKICHIQWLSLGQTEGDKDENVFELRFAKEDEDDD